MIHEINHVSVYVPATQKCCGTKSVVCVRLARIFDDGRAPMYRIVQRRRSPPLYYLLLTNVRLMQFFSETNVLRENNRKKMFR